MDERVGYRLVPVRGVAKGRNGDYRAIIDNNGRTLGTDAVLRETIERYQFRIAPNLLKTYVSAVLETMMANTAQDGLRRRFEDFFTVRLDIRGTFAGRDSKPDGSQRAVLNLQPMGEFRRATRRVGRGDWGQAPLPARRRGPRRVHLSLPLRRITWSCEMAHLTDAGRPDPSR